MSPFFAQYSLLQILCSAEPAGAAGAVCATTFGTAKVPSVPAAAQETALARRVRRDVASLLAIKGPHFFRTGKINVPHCRWSGEISLQGRAIQFVLPPCHDQGGNSISYHINQRAKHAHEAV